MPRSSLFPNGTAEIITQITHEQTVVHLDPSKSASAHILITRDVMCGGGVSPPHSSLVDISANFIGDPAMGKKISGAVSASEERYFGT